MRFRLLALTLAAAAIASAFAADPRRPNIVVFLADDLSVNDCTPYGNKVFQTPNMEKMARAGMMFERAYVASPSCAPSRAALLTGLYPLRNGAMFNHQKARGELEKWPGYFQKLGYEVVAIGKVSHYADVKTYGFDYADFFNYHQDICVEKAVEWLDARKSDKPLCLFVGTNWPHVPWPQRLGLPPGQIDIPAKLADTEETRKARARYESAVENADRDLGMIRDAVRKNLPDDTFFLFTADHGSQFPFHKWNLYETGLRVPLMASWKDKIKPGSETNAMVSWIDILPTLLEVAGADPKKAAPDIDGISFLPVLLGETQKGRDYIFSTHSGDGNMNFYPSRAVRDQRWRYIRNLDPNLEFHTHVDRAQADTGYWSSWERKARTDPATAELVQKYYHRPAEELYDLQSDPGELNNLANDPASATELKRLRTELDGWMKSLDDKGMATDTAMKPIPPKKKETDAGKKPDGAEVDP